MRKIQFPALLALMFALPAFAPGSLALDDIAPLLRQRPELSVPFLAAFDLRDSAMGVRLGHQFKHLSAARIGPYSVEARARGSHGPYTLEVLVCTEALFLDANGRKAEMFEAAQVKESLQGFVVQPPGGKIHCPDY